MDTFAVLTGQYCQNGTMDRWNTYRNTLRHEGMPALITNSTSPNRRP